MAVCLITGGAGFLGSHLAAELLARGHAVRVLDDFSTGRPENLAEVEDRIELVRGSVTDLAAVRGATAGADYVFHLAAPPARTEGPADPMAAHHAGATGTLHVLIAARDARVRRVLYASSCYVYGERSGRPRREDEPPQPLCPYGLAKLMGEQQCAAFTGLYGLETVRLRYFSVFGPRQPASSPYTAALAEIIQQALAGRRAALPGGPAGPQDLLAVDDAVHATLLAAGTRRAVGRVYNVGGGRLRTVAQVLAALSAILGTTPPPRQAPPGPGEEVGYLADTRKAEAELGFCPATDFEKGLRRCVEFYRGRSARPAFQLNE
jgi:UDP-glucose 4-epimerase